MFLLADFRYALRLLIKTPYFSLLTVLVLSGGLAISIYTFSVLNTMLYKPLPLPDSERIVRILGKKEGKNTLLGAFELSQMRQDTQSLREFGVYGTGTALMSWLDAARSLKATFSEWDIFRFSRTQPLLGRAFQAQDNIDGAEPVAVISHKTWQSVFAGDPGVIDAVVTINGRPTRIVGVMPEGYAFPITTEVWLPLTRSEISPAGYSDTVLNAYARLNQEASAAQADTELTSLLRRVQRVFPRIDGKAEEQAKLTAFVSSFQLAQTGSEGVFVFAVLNIVSLFILLLACVNVGNLLLARSNERIKETAIRLALGAPRIRLMVQMSLESVLICIVGGAVAILIAGWVLAATNRFLSSTFEGDLPFWWHWGLDGDSVAMAVLFIAVAIVLVAALPAYNATSANFNSLLRDGTRGAQGRASGRITRSLVIVEIVLISVVMQIGSVMALIAYRAAHVDFGVDTTNLVTTPIELTGEAYDTPEERLGFYERLLGELRGSGDFEGAMVLQELGESKYAIDDSEYNLATDYPMAALVVASETPVAIGTHLVEGRNFDSRDNTEGLETAIVSQSLARQHWPHSSPLGKRIRLIKEGGVEESRTIIGVMSDVKRGELLTESKDNLMSIYVPLPQTILPSATVLAKHHGDENAARDALYRTIGSLDPYIAPARIMSYDTVLKKLTLMATSITDLFVRCGVFAILLAMTGIYGLTSNAVVQRTQEIGLRRAVGANDRDIIVLFLKQGLRLLGMGLFISASICATILFVVSRFAGVSATVLTAAGLSVAAIITCLVLLAVYVPTRRAVEQEPNIALRYE